MANSKVGLFITIEGGEATGKTTQLEKLKQHYADDPSYYFTREPGGTEFAENIRDMIVSGAKDKLLPVSELLLLNAARYDHINRVILPKIKDGINVICDRFFDSTIAYQSAARGLDESLIYKLHELVTDNFFPDLTLVLDLDPALAKSRIKERNKSEDERFEKFSGDFHEKVRLSFVKLAQKPGRNIKLLDASQPREEIFSQMITSIKNCNKR